MSKRRWLVVVPVFWFAFVVNPAYVVGCGSAESSPKFSFGEADMLKLIDAVNAAQPIAFTSGDAHYTADFSLLQKPGADQDDTSFRAPPALALQAYACGNRTFLQSASACITVSELPVTGIVTLREQVAGGDNPLPMTLIVKGTLRVYGYDMRSASLDLNDQVDTISLQSSDGRSVQLTVFDAPMLGAGGTDISFVKP